MSDEDKDEKYLYYYGASKIMLSDESEGERVLKEIDLKSEIYIDAEYYLGLSSFHQQKYVEAIAFFTDYLRKYPRNKSALHFRAYSYSQIGEYDLSIPDYTEIINQNQNAGEFLFARGLCFSKIGNIANAKTDWLSAANCKPSDEWALVKLAEIESTNQNYSLALQYIIRATKINRKIKKDYKLFIQDLMDKKET